MGGYLSSNQQLPTAIHADGQLDTVKETNEINNNPRNVVIIPIDKSKQAETAFECKMFSVVVRLQPVQLYVK